MTLETWELLSYIVTLEALPFAIGVFLVEQRKERANEQEATWQQISDACIDFLEVVLANPDLKLRSQLATPDLTDEQRERMLLIFDMLISLFERARGVWPLRSDALERSDTHRQQRQTDKPLGPVNLRWVSLRYTNLHMRLALRH